MKFLWEFLFPFVGCCVVVFVVINFAISTINDFVILKKRVEILESKINKV